MPHRWSIGPAALLLFALTEPAAAAGPDPAEAVPPPAEALPGATREPAPAPLVVTKNRAATTQAVAGACKAAPLPLYVEDWGRLADLTREDPRVFQQADFWRIRRENTRWLVAGIVAGSGVATLATAHRLQTGEWSDRNKWMLVGGLTTALVSTLAYWAFSPDRDDLLTVLNHWNLRHPDRPLAP
jgi:hypothetical protein